MASWDWTDINLPPDNAEVWWKVDIATHNASLEITGTSTVFGAYEARVATVPVAWDTPAIYVITSWNTLTPGLTSAEAAFTF